MKILDELLLKQYRGAGCCQFCGIFNTYREAAHILSKGMGGAHRIDHPWNLVSLGWAFGCGCHVKHHAGKSPTAAMLWAVVDKREGIPPGTAEHEINRLRRL